MLVTPPVIHFISTSLYSLPATLPPQSSCCTLLTSLRKSSWNVFTEVDSPLRTLAIAQRESRVNKWYTCLFLKNKCQCGLLIIKTVTSKAVLMHHGSNGFGLIFMVRIKIKDLQTLCKSPPWTGQTQSRSRNLSVHTGSKSWHTQMGWQDKWKLMRNVYSASHCDGTSHVVQTTAAHDTGTQVTLVCMSLAVITFATQPAQAQQESAGPFPCRLSKTGWRLVDPLARDLTLQRHCPAHSTAWALMWLCPTA